MELRGRSLCEPVGRAQGARGLSSLARVGLLRLVEEVAEDAFRVMREGLRVFVGALTIRSEVPDSLAGCAPDLADLFAE